MPRRNRIVFAASISVCALAGAAIASPTESGIARLDPAAPISLPFELDAAQGDASLSEGVSTNGPVIEPATNPDHETSGAETGSPAATLAQLVERHASADAADREQECLAGAVYFEAKSESLEGQLAVAQVIVNRARSGRFPSSFCSVVFQKSQFSFVRGGDFPAFSRAGAAWKRAVAVARVAQQGLWTDIAEKALFFHARHVSPGWKLKRIAAVGNHVFYR